VAEPNDEIPKINPSEVESLINKIEQSNLDEQDKRMITLKWTHKAGHESYAFS
jgi:hypothetical protein